MTPKKSFGTFVATTVMILTATNAHTKDNKGTEKKAQKGECHGVNSCKGKGECGSPNWECAGNNSCKGQGWVTKTSEDCKKLGGRFKADL